MTKQSDSTLDFCNHSRGAPDKFRFSGFSLQTNDLIIQGNCLYHMHILLATLNAWKIQLITPVFRDYGFEVTTLVALPGIDPSPLGNGKTALENAIAKARNYHSEVFPWFFGDDAGNQK